LVVLDKQNETPADLAKTLPAGYTVYVTQKGENIMGIAHRNLGDSMRWRHILACNPRYAPVLPHEEFSPGVVLVIPPIFDEVKVGG